MHPSVAQWFVIIWFGLSVPAAVLGRFVFGWWLAKHGARVESFWLGTPEYLERVYDDWCIGRGQSARAGLVALRGSLINAVLAAIAFFIALANRR